VEVIQSPAEAKYEFSSPKGLWERLLEWLLLRPQLFAEANTPSSSSKASDTAGSPSEEHLLKSAVNMELSIIALGTALESVETPASPQLARSVQATENAYREMEDEFQLLTSIEVSEVVGSRSPNRSYASEQRSAGKLLAIKRAGGFRYPGFQIDRQEQRIRPVMADLLRVAKQTGRSEASLALWMTTPTGYLDGARPVDQLADHPAKVVEAARQSFSVQW
jgi:hypothetical protein